MVQTYVQDIINPDIINYYYMVPNPHGIIIIRQSHVYYNNCCRIANIDRMGS